MYFSISAILVNIIVLFSIILRKMTKGITNILFLIATVSSIIMGVANTVNIYIVDNPGVMGDNFVALFRYVYLAAYCILQSTYVLYIISLLDIWHIIKINKALNILLISLCSINIILLSLNGITHMIFSVENGEYITGSYWLIFILNTLLLALFSNNILTKFKSLLSDTKVNSLRLTYVVVILAYLIMTLDQRLDMVDIAISLSLVNIVIMVQRPEEKIDISTGLNNLNAYINELNSIFITGKKSTVILINIYNFEILQNMLGYNTNKSLISIIACKLEKLGIYYKIPFIDYYYLGSGKLRAVLSHYTDRTFDLANDINKYLHEDFSINNMDITIQSNVYILDCNNDVKNFQEAFDLETHLKYDTDKDTVIFIKDIESSKKNKYASNINDIIARAIASNSFKVYYQPIYSNEKKKFNSAEALIRLEDEKEGFIPPDIFIPAAEASGEIHRIGNFVLDEVLSFIGDTQFKKLGLDYIEVNLSAIQCMQAGLAESIKQKIKKYGVGAEQLNFEITETALCYSQNTFDNNIRQLVDYGIKLSLDDYGTGYSNVSRLSQLPLDIVKFDKSFADGIENPKMTIILENTVKMIKDMKMKIVVEGVETLDILEKFNTLQCEYIQGYYYSKPLPKDEFIEFLKKNNQIKETDKV